jgi:GTP-binding protein YchF
MGLQIGIVGLPNVGKSTLFNALTRANAPVASYPFTTIEPNVGVVAVPDERLADIAAIVQPERVTPTTIEFVDVAGLVRGASQGEGLGNQFLGHIRNVDAIAMVVRCFCAADIPHVTATLDPQADIEVLKLELALADLTTVERRLEKARPKAKAHPREYADELALLERLREGLSAGRVALELDRTPEEGHVLRELNLLTDKPLLYVANGGEEELPEGSDLAAAVREKAAAEGAAALVLCAQLEEELAEWPPDEAAAYRAELGLGEAGLQRLIKAGYTLLGLITFFTTTGGHEVRAWTLQRGMTVLEAAGKIHTDMQRGFIRAEILSYQDLMRAGSFAVAREQGRIRIEGRDYVVQDGDIIHVRFRA